MRVQNLGAACCLIETPDLRILCDPWFTDGVYDGSWFRWPRVPEFTDPVDAIWVSHLHPDHYDPVFLKSYLFRYPQTRLLCAKHDPPFLQKMMAADGFQVETFDHLRIGETDLWAVCADAQPLANID